MQHIVTVTLVCLGNLNTRVTSVSEWGLGGGDEVRVSGRGGGEERRGQNCQIKAQFNLLLSILGLVSALSDSQFGIFKVYGKSHQLL